MENAAQAHSAGLSPEPSQGDEQSSKVFRIRKVVGGFIFPEHQINQLAEHPIGRDIVLNNGNYPISQESTTHRLDLVIRPRSHESPDFQDRFEMLFDPDANELLQSAPFKSLEVEQNGLSLFSDSPQKIIQHLGQMWEAAAASEVRLSGSDFIPRLGPVYGLGQQDWKVDIGFQHCSTVLGYILMAPFPDGDAVPEHAQAGNTNFPQGFLTDSSLTISEVKCLTKIFRRHRGRPTIPAVCMLSISHHKLQDHGRYLYTCSARIIHAVLSHVGDYVYDRQLMTDPKREFTLEIFISPTIVSKSKHKNHKQSPELFMAGSGPGNTCQQSPVSEQKAVMHLLRWMLASSSLHEFSKQNGWFEGMRDATPVPSQE